MKCTTLANQCVLTAITCACFRFASVHAAYSTTVSAVYRWTRKGRQQSPSGHSMARRNYRHRHMPDLDTAGATASLGGTTSLMCSHCNHPHGAGDMSAWWLTYRTARYATWTPARHAIVHPAAEDEACTVLEYLLTYTASSTTRH